MKPVQPVARWAPFVLAALTLRTLAAPVSSGELRIAGALPTPYERAAVVRLGDQILALHGGTVAVWEAQARHWRVIPKLKGVGPAEMDGRRVTVLDEHRLLLSGGTTRADPTLWVWDARIESWQHGPGLLQARMAHTATRLADGHVLIAGGSTGSHASDPRGIVLSTVEEFDGDRSIALPEMTKARASHTAILLTDGRVLLAGGVSLHGEILSETQLWDPLLRRWAAGPPLNAARRDHTAVLLDDGRVMIAGGTDAAGKSLRAVEIWKPGDDTWNIADSLPVAISGHSAVLLTSGDVLIAGTRASFVMLWDSATHEWLPAGYRPAASFAVDLVPLANGEALLHNGQFLLQWQTTRAPTPTSAYGRRNAFALTSLAAGQVMISGGASDDRVLVDWVELFDRRTDRFTLTGRLEQPRSGHRAIALDDGRVLVVGGVVETTAAATPQFTAATLELWSPETGRWQTLGEPHIEDAEEIVAEKLTDGRVLIVALQRRGTSELAYRSWVWHLDTGRMQELPVGIEPRRGASVSILRDGHVVIAGGRVRRPVLVPPCHPPEGEPDEDCSADECVPDCIAEEQSTDSRTEERLANVLIWHTVTNEIRMLEAPWVVHADHWITRPLSRGRILIIEGRVSFDEPGSEGRPGLSTFLLDAAGGEWSALGTLNTYYSMDSSFAELSDGTLYAAGPDNAFTLAPGSTSWVRSPSRPLSRGPLVKSGPDTATAFGFDWRGAAVHLDLRTGRWFHAVDSYYIRRRPAFAQLEDGRLLVIGGDTERVQSFDSQRERWSAETDLPMPVAFPQAIQPVDGKIMVVGLTGEDQIECVTSSTEKLAWQRCGKLSARQERDRAFGLGLMPDGKPLLVLSDREAAIYDSIRNLWTTVRVEPGSGRNDAPLGRIESGAAGPGFDVTALVSAVKWSGGGVTLHDGRVLTPACRLWDEPKHTWLNLSPRLATVCWADRMVVLPDGCVLIAGATLHVFDPAKLQYFRVEELAIKATDPSMQVLDDGSVVIAGSATDPTDARFAFYRLKASCGRVEPLSSNLARMPGQGPHALVPIDGGESVRASVSRPATPRVQEPKPPFDPREWLWTVPLALLLALLSRRPRSKPPSSLPT